MVDFFSFSVVVVVVVVVVVGRIFLETEKVLFFFFRWGKGEGVSFFFMFCCSPKRKRRQGNPQNLSAEIPRISEPQIAQFPRFFFFFDQQSRLMERLALILFGTVLAVMNFKTRHSLFR